MKDERAYVRLSDAQRLDWLRLIRSENVGPRTFRALINQYAGAAKAIENIADLARRGGRTDLNIMSRAEAEAEMADAKRHGVRLIAIGEEEYPARLRETDDAPPLLGVRGQAEALARDGIAIVGARNASAAGMRFAAKLAREIGEAGFVTISGLARGIDSAGHNASLATGTIAVLAGGHDRIYPSEHFGLAEEIVKNGAAVSEMPMGWEPRARDFPRRNRIIAGIAVGIVVVEAAERSGSLITARLALEMGREVFAVPGSPIDPRASGTNRLIKQGATVVTSAEDVIEAIKPIVGRAKPVPPKDDKLREPSAPDRTAPGPEADDALRSRVSKLLSHAPVSADELARLADAPAGAVQIVLLELELAGRIERHGGGLVSLR
jgi:DNA processing protein